MKILIVTDAWHPQVNGVVRTLDTVSHHLEKAGHKVAFLTPDQFRTVPLPTYAEIRLALATPTMIARRIEAETPDSIHIATEGVLGILARHYCLKRGIAFTTSYHTRFPEFVRARLPIPERWTYALLRRFHNSGAGMLVATKSLAGEMAERGFRHLRMWSRGVDCTQFDPVKRIDLNLPGPIFLNVGRVAVEKNLEAFLDLELPGTKVIVGDGPDLLRLKERYPQVQFFGTKTGENLAAIYASADVFVFPSRTDTFGNVILEALASGTPVAAYPVTGPIDIIGDGVGGFVSHDLREAALAALLISRDEAREKAKAYDWDECARQFLAALVPADVSSRQKPVHEGRNDFARSSVDRLGKSGSVV